MKKRILTAAVLVMTMLFGTAMQASAASDVITFDGDAKQFVTAISGDAENGFEGMLPGESRTITMELYNEASEELKFFMNSDILTADIAEQGDKRAVYDFSISADGEEFFCAVIGGEEKENISAGKEFLTEKHSILLATLAKGEKTTITICLSLDGDSTENAYMNAAGKLTFRFSAETPEEPPTIIEEVIKTVITGDMTSITAIIGVAGIALLAIIIVLVQKRKNRVEDRK